jgi:hypothetical protein
LNEAVGVGVDALVVDDVVAEPDGADLCVADALSRLIDRGGDANVLRRDRRQRHQQQGERDECAKRDHL